MCCILFHIQWQLVRLGCAVHSFLPSAASSFHIGQQSPFTTFAVWRAWCVFFVVFCWGGWVTPATDCFSSVAAKMNDVTPCITFLFPVSPSNCSLFLWRWIFLKVSTKSFLSKSLASSCACPHVNLPIFTQVKISIQSRTNTKSYYILYLFSMTYQNKSVSYTIVLPFTVLLSLCRVYASIHWLCVKMYLKVLLPANIKRR